MSTQDFLFELGCEELPTSALKKAGTDLVSAIEKSLKQTGLGFAGIEGIAAPRRLGVLVRDLQLKQPDQTLTLRGPSKAVGLDDNGQPTRALEGFCKKNGIQPAELTEIETPKGVWLEYRGTREGAMAADVMPALCAAA
ncbi:MAG: glycine--tRNA ligase subunit beta, partial [Litorivicinus sp.]